MLSLRVSDRVEATDTHDLANSLATAIVCIRVCPEDSAQKCLQPKLVGSLALFASFVHTVTLDRTGNSHVDAHIESGECIVATAGCQLRLALVLWVDELKHTSIRLLQPLLSHWALVPDGSGC